MYMYLHHEGDEHGKHREREAEDVEQRQSHEGLVGSEPVIWVCGVSVHQHKCGKRGKCNLQQQVKYVIGTYARVM